MKNYKTCFNCNSKNIEKNENTILCKDCGFHTNEQFTDLSKSYHKKPTTKFDLYMVTQPLIIWDLMLHDKDNKLYWLPHILNISPIGILYPIGNSVNNWQWGFSKYKKIDEKDRKNYPNPAKPGEYYEYQLDIENQVLCNSYAEGLSYFNEYLSTQ